MESIQFPRNFVKLIFEMRENFTKPSFKHFKVVLSAILIGGPKKTLTSGIRLHNLKCHFSNIHRFVGEYKWDITQVVFSLFNIMNKILKLSKYLVFGLDDTFIRSVPLTCVATSLLMLWSFQETNQRAPELWDIQPWITQKSSPSLFDVMNQFKAKCITNSIFSVLRRRGIEPQKYSEIELILRRAA